MSLDTERSSEIESERQDLLRDLANEMDADWTEKFKPGTSGCHELLDRTNLLANLIEENVLSHPSCALNAEWYALAEGALENLRELYQRVGAQHL
jgi:hypothetical protein